MLKDWVKFKEDETEVIAALMLKKSQANELSNRYRSCTKEQMRRIWHFSETKIQAITAAAPGRPDPSCLGLGTHDDDETDDKDNDRRARGRGRGRPPVHLLRLLLTASLLLFLRLRHPPLTPRPRIHRRHDLESPDRGGRSTAKELKLQSILQGLLDSQRIRIRIRVILLDADRWLTHLNLSLLLVIAVGLTCLCCLGLDDGPKFDAERSLWRRHVRDDAQSCRTQRSSSKAGNWQKTEGQSSSQGAGAC
jgi:hypothetical protein